MKVPWLKLVLVLAQALAWSLGFVALLIGVLVAVSYFFYDRQFDALKNTVEKHGYEITDQWRHEDITLEDFGFTIRTSSGVCRVDIRDGTDVRMPGDRIDGLRITDARHGMTGTLLFDSEYWREARLPKIQTVSDLIAHLPHVVAALNNHPPKYPPDKTPEDRYPRSKKLFLTLPADVPHKTAPAI